MARVIKFPVTTPQKIGFKRVKRRKKANLEDHGQLNMFSPESTAKVVDLNSRGSAFDKALFYDERDQDKAVDFYLQSIKQEEHSSDAYCNLGIIYSNKHDYVKAIDYFTKSLVIDPRHAESHYNLGNVYSEIENLQLARVHYEMAVKLDSELVSAYYNLGLVLAMTEELQDAIQMLKIFQKKSEVKLDGQIDKLISDLQAIIQKRHYEK